MSSILQLFKWLTGANATKDLLVENTHEVVKDLFQCLRCEEFVTEDDIYKRRRRGKVKMGKYCKKCGKKGYRPG